MTPPVDPVLVVDDTEHNRDLLSRRLQRAGYPVAVAASGQEALDYLAAHPVSVVLLDVRMAGMSGLEVLQAIRQTWAATHLPVIMVTANDGSEDIVTAFDLGADDYVTKPIDFPVALARVRTQLARKDAEDRLRASEERYAVAARGANDGLWDWNLSTGDVYFSARWKAIVGYDERDIGQAPEEWFERVHPEDLLEVRAELDAHLAGRTPHFEHEHRVRHRDGGFRWVLARGMAVRDEAGFAVRLAGSLSDVTAAKVVDPVTGLPNKILLIDRLERVLHHQRDLDAQCAVLFLDLDDFKLVNDSLGIARGDELLEAVAARLQASLGALDRESENPDAVTRREDQTIARIGGDEFVILLPETRGAIEAARVAERLQRDFRPAFTIGGHEIFSTVSIGIALGTTGHEKPEDLLRDADTAMDRAKAVGKGRIEHFDIAMRDRVRERLQLETALRQALDREEFVPHFQPIIDLQTGELAGFEALIRWQHPERGLVLPGEFITAVEDNGLVTAIGRQFFAVVARQLRAWHAARPGRRPLSLNVNFAGRQFLEPGLVEYLLTTLHEAGLDPGQLVVEVTESTAIADLDRATTVLGQIHDAGLRVALDDFGTGYSSLSCLHELPIDGVKLDRSFVANERRHPEILRAMVLLAEHLGLTVTAEGIETARQWRQLRDLGCQFAQGFLFSKPLDATAATALVENDQNWLPEDTTPVAVAGR